MAATPSGTTLLIHTSRVLGIYALAACLSSCVPLLVGAAVGYVARDEGIGIAPPLNSSEKYDAPAPSDNEAYDEPVY